MAKKMALGKGIASLLQETPNQILRSTLASENEAKESSKNESKELSGGSLSVKIETIKTNPEQPRKIFNEEALLELSSSIKENGIIQPLIVTKSNDEIELVAGERRLRAAKMAGLEMVPVVFQRTTRKEKMVFAIIENVQREDLNCVEEALAYYQLMSEFKLTQEEVAKK